MEITNRKCYKYDILLYSHVYKQAATHCMESMPWIAKKKTFTHKLKIL